jgi:hypothetical protein
LLFGANKAVWNGGDHMLIAHRKEGYVNEGYGSIWPYMTFGFCFWTQKSETDCPHEYGHGNKRRHVPCIDEQSPMSPLDTSYPFRHGRIFHVNDVDGLPLGTGDYHHFDMSNLQEFTGTNSFDVMTCKFLSFNYNINNIQHDNYRCLQ